LIEGKEEHTIINGKKNQSMIPLDPEVLELEALEWGCENISIQEGIAEILTTRDDFVHIKKMVEEA
jgi:hypothetical protein